MSKITDVESFLDEFGDQPTLLDTLEELGPPTIDNFHLWREAYREYTATNEGPALPFSPDPEINKNHRVSISEKDPTLFAYFESEEKMRRDIKTQIKPGKYLTNFYKDKFNAEQVKKLVDDHVFNVSPPELHITGPDDLELCEEIYEKGPSSCMTRAKGYVKTGIHPARVYATEDVGIAFVRKGGRITARAVINRKKKTYTGKIYGHEIIKELLTKEGYKSGSLDGCRIRRIQDPTNVNVCIIPYLDGNAHNVMADDQHPNDFLIVTSRSSNGKTVFAAQATSALINIPKAGSKQCSHCGTFHEGDHFHAHPPRHDGGSEDICDECFTNFFVTAEDSRARDVTALRENAAFVGTRIFADPAIAHDAGFSRLEDGTWIPSRDRVNVTFQYNGQTIERDVYIPLETPVLAGSVYDIVLSAYTQSETNETMYFFINPHRTATEVRYFTTKIIADTVGATRTVRDLVIALLTDYPQQLHNFAGLNQQYIADFLSELYSTPYNPQADLLVRAVYNACLTQECAVTPRAVSAA